MIRADDRFMDSETLIHLNNKAIEANYNRSLDPEIYNRLDPNGYHVVHMCAYMEGPVTRSFLTIKIKDQPADKPLTGHSLDMHYEDYENLMSWRKAGKIMESMKECPECGMHKPIGPGDYLCFDCRGIPFE